MMKVFKLTKLLTVFIFIVLVGTSYAFQFTDVIEKANAAYQKEGYETALNAYLKVNKSGYESSDLYYNIANCYYRLNKLGYSIAYYEKALLLNPGDEDTKYNLSIAKAHTIDKINEVPKLFIEEWWEAFLSVMNLSGWAIVTSLLYILTLTGFTVYYFARTLSSRRLGFYLGTLFLVFTLVSGVSFASKYNLENSSKYGVLIENVYTAKQSPTENSADAFVIHEGIKFSVEDELDEWVKIKLADGKVGWLPRNTFLPI